MAELESKKGDVQAVLNSMGEVIALATDVILTCMDRLVGTALHSFACSRPRIESDEVGDDDTPHGHESGSDNDAAADDADAKDIRC